MAFQIRPELREERQGFVLPFPTNDKSLGKDCSWVERIKNS